LRPFDGRAAIVTKRLRLLSLRPEDADELAAVLGDERLHEFVGGRPSPLPELRADFARLAAGSPDPGVAWLNWVVRLRGGGAPVGTVQATVRSREGTLAADVAWVIGVDWQNRGFASEAARALVDWLRQRGVEEVVAHIHPDHTASGVVARRAGLLPTEELAGGERVWRATLES
jgi:RimJ/RimL family protein N-acetyltransferase